MQIPDKEKAGRCDYVIDNTGSLEATRALVERIYQELVLAAMKGKPQTSPLRYAPVEMTILLQGSFRTFPGNSEFHLQQNCHLDRSIA